MYILVNRQSEEAKAYKLSKEDLVLGSSPDVHIIINETTVSRKHLRLTLNNNSWYIHDLGSRNGSFLQSSQLIPGKKYEINENEVITLGNGVELKLVQNAEEASELSNSNIEAKALLTPPPHIPDEDKTRMIDLSGFKQLKMLEQKKMNGKKNETPKRRTPDPGILTFTLLCLGLIGFIYLTRKPDTGSIRSNTEAIIEENTVSQDEKQNIETLNTSVDKHR